MSICSYISTVIALFKVRLQAMGYRIKRIVINPLASQLKRLKIPLALMAFFGLVLGSSAYAMGSSSDLLAGTSAQLADTIKGSGKHYIYLAEGLLSLAAYIRTKNMLVLFGIVVVAVFFNIIIKISGL